MWHPARRLVGRVDESWGCVHLVATHMHQHQSNEGARVSRPYHATCAWVCASGRAARVSGQLLGVRRASPGLSNMTNANRFTNADTLCILSYTAPDCALAGMIYGKPALRLRSRYSAVNLYVQAALMQASCAESDFDNFCSG